MNKEKLFYQAEYDKWMASNMRKAKKNFLRFSRMIFKNEEERTEPLKGKYWRLA